MELQGIVEIFQRKKEMDDSVNELSKIGCYENDELDEKKNFQLELDKQLSDEIMNFRTKREEDLLKIVQKFLRDKLETNKILTGY
jgi:hypothetical protein